MPRKGRWRGSSARRPRGCPPTVRRAHDAFLMRRAAAAAAVGMLEFARFPARGGTMSPSIARLSPTQCAGIVAALLLTAMSGHAARTLQAQAAPAEQVPDLTGVWDGGRRSHPTNSANSPWAKTLPEGAILPDGTAAGK